MANVKLAAFEAIRDHLLANVKDDNGKVILQRVALFNNQFDNEDRENAFPYPNVFIEFGTIDWEKKSRNIQQGPVTFTFHCGFESYVENSIENDAAIFDILDRIHVVLQGFSDGECFNLLDRTTERQDADHDNVVVWEMDYDTILLDTAAATELKTVTSAGPHELDVTRDLDIDNDVIRSGDGIVP